MFFSIRYTQSSLKGYSSLVSWILIMRTLFGDLLHANHWLSGSWMCVMIWGFCSTQAFSPKVVTGHGPCREQVLRNSFVLAWAGMADRLQDLGLLQMEWPSTMSSSFPHAVQW